MTIHFRQIIIIIAMLLVATILVICIVNDINHSIIYTGLTIIGGLAGYTLGKATTHK